MLHEMHFAPAAAITTFSGGIYISHQFEARAISTSTDNAHAALGLLRRPLERGEILIARKTNGNHWNKIVLFNKYDLQEIVDTCLPQHIIFISNLTAPYRMQQFSKEEEELFETLPVHVQINLTAYYPWIVNALHKRKSPLVKFARNSSTQTEQEAPKINRDSSIQTDEQPAPSNSLTKKWTFLWAAIPVAVAASFIAYKWFFAKR